MEDELNQKQAQFWKRDTDEFFDNEKRKNDYIKQVNLKHADILKQQMSDKHGKTKVKMSTQELLQNKAKLKEMQSKGDIPLEKQMVVVGNKM